MTIRIVLPTNSPRLGEGHPDVLIIQFDGMTANPHPENPICRNPLRPDLYHKGEKQQILNIPGSELEDRQYQFNLTNLRVQTGRWDELRDIFMKEVTVSSQQNPALDWNEGRSPMFQVPAHQLMHPLINSFNLTLLLAPAMLYRGKDIVCGHATEINAVSDIIVSLTLDQLSLCGVLSSEVSSMLHSVSQRQVRSRTVVPSGPSANQRLPHSLTELDSGIESTESTSSHARHVDPNLPAVHAVASSAFSQVSGFVPSSSVYPSPLAWPSKRYVIPWEVLVTGSALTFAVFSIESTAQLCYEPLLYAHISQPHTFLCRNTDNLMTYQVSAFDLGLSCGVRGHLTPKQVVTKPFPQPLLESRGGDPHPRNGIPPALITAKMSWDNLKPPKIDVDMGRPIRLVCNLEIIDYLKRLQELVHASFSLPVDSYTTPKDGPRKESKRDSSAEENEHYLYGLLKHFNKLSFNTQQIVLAISSSVEKGAELCVSVGACSGEASSVMTVQQLLVADLSLHTITVSNHSMTCQQSRLLVDPWQVSVHCSLGWESWLSPRDPPLVNMSANADVLSLHLSAQYLRCLSAVWEDYAPLLHSAKTTSDKPVLSRGNSTGDSSSEEQHYHDDLQAGAFQFVESAGARDDLPLTYQVVFWTGEVEGVGSPTMTWRYPQPRAITKFSMLPVPFTVSVLENSLWDLYCRLEYYSESQTSYQDYVHFKLSETESQLVELPQGPPRVVATVWRVVLNDACLTSIRALAASIRVDSFFSPSLVPAAQLALKLAAVQVTLWTHTDSHLPLSEPLDRYYLDRRFPEEHDFCSAVLERVHVEYSVWPKVSQHVLLRGWLRLDVLNYSTLMTQCCILPVILRTTGYLTSDCQEWSVWLEELQVRLGPALSHCLQTALSGWLSPPSHQHIITPYVVCNNTCLPIKFRQAGSEVYIPLQCFQCHMYSWRTTKHPMQLEFGLLESEDEEWSKGVSLRAGCSTVIRLTLAAKELALIISTKQLTPTVCQVTVNGQLAFHNNLSSAVDVRVVPECGDQCSLLVQSGCSPPTVVTDPRYSVSLKVRFTASTLWSGEIPLKPMGKRTKQWEVKLPLKDKGQFRSVWCHVVWDIVDNIHQVLMVLSPLYTIKSLLPCQASVVVESPGLSSRQALPISGKGALQQLDTPGLSLEIHNLTFQLHGQESSGQVGNAASSPPVSLNYHLLDGSPTPPASDSDVASLMSCVQSARPPRDKEWPYLGRDWACVDWIVTTQPDTLTQVKIRFLDDCVATNTLVVEVQPWALLVNTLGAHVYLQGRDRTLCSVAHRTVISPPPLESTFQIGVELDNSVQLSDAIQLQLKRGPGFEMPHIPGLLPPCGFINTVVTGKDSVCFLNVTSSEVNNLRLIHLKSSYVVASLSKRDLFVSGIAVKPSGSQHTLPTDVLRHSTHLRSQAKPSKLRCQPLTEWRLLGTEDSELVPYLVVGVRGVMSCPVRVPAGPDRHSVAVIFPAAPRDCVHDMLCATTQMTDGQTHILLWDQPCPQVTLHNNTTSTVLFAKAVTDGGGGQFVSDCEHIAWQLRASPGSVAHYQFPLVTTGPDTPQPNSLPPATIAVLSDTTSGQRWSEPITLTQCSGRLLTLLGLADLSLSVSRRGFTTHVTLMQASHTEILAVDIRGQLSRQLINERKLSDVSQRSAVDEQHETTTDDQVLVPPSLPPSESGASDRLGGLNVSCYVRRLTTTLLSQTEKGCECREVAALTLDHLGVTLHPHPHQDSSVREIKIHATVGDMQLDNQEFSRGGYDFPVVMLMQKPQRREPIGEDLVWGNNPARQLVDEARGRGSAADLTLVVDVNSHATLAVQDVSVKLQPLQIYIEDKYILHLRDCLLNTLPFSIFSETPASVTKPGHSTPLRNVVEPKSKPKESLKPVENEVTDNTTGNLSKEASEGAEEEDLFNVSEPDAENQLSEEVATINTDASLSKMVTPAYQQESVWTVPSSGMTNHQEEAQDSVTESEGFPISTDVLSASRDLARPLRLRSLSISELDLLVSIHTSTRFYIALDHSPLQLAAFKRSSLFTTAYRLGHSLTLHYFFGAIYGTGWALGSLELLGAPGGLARSLGLGLRDFISLPLQGILVGPRAFFMGIAHGSASLMQHFAAGTITSVTRLAASWARTLDRLTLDCRDLERSEQLRRLRPQSLTQGVVQGLTEFGISLIGAISSIAHHPLQYVMSEEPDRSLVNSIGLGLVGVITRPLSGVAELVALTGEGLLSGVGWTNTPQVRHKPLMEHCHPGCGRDSWLKYRWKLLLSPEQLLLVTEATTDCFQGVTLLITTGSLYVVNSELDIVVRAVKLSELYPVNDIDDPTVVAFKIQPAREQAQLLSQSRILEYVRDSQRALTGELRFPLPMWPPDSYVDNNEAHHCFFINPQVRTHFLAILRFATSHAIGRGFPVIS